MAARPSAESTRPPAPASKTVATVQSGLSSGAASRRLAALGPNATPDTSARPLRRALGKFWALVPWMLEAAILLQLICLGRRRRHS
jgi:H+-transporting ATPase